MEQWLGVGCAARMMCSSPIEYEWHLYLRWVPVLHYTLFGSFHPYKSYVWRVLPELTEISTCSGCTKFQLIICNGRQLTFESWAILAIMTLRTAHRRLDFGTRSDLNIVITVMPLDRSFFCMILRRSLYTVYTQLQCCLSTNQTAVGKINLSNILFFLLPSCVERTDLLNVATRSTLHSRHGIIFSSRHLTANRRAMTTLGLMRMKYEIFQGFFRSSCAIRNNADLKINTNMMFLVSFWRGSDLFLTSILRSVALHVYTEKAMYVEQSHIEYYTQTASGYEVKKERKIARVLSPFKKNRMIIIPLGYFRCQW